MNIGTVEWHPNIYQVYEGTDGHYAFLIMPNYIRGKEDEYMLLCADYRRKNGHPFWRIICTGDLDILKENYAMIIQKTAHEHNWENTKE